MEPGLQDAAAESAQRAWKALTEYIVNESAKRDIVKAQLADPSFHGLCHCRLYNKP